MMQGKSYILREEAGIAWFTINRPQVLNALDPDSWMEIEAFCDYFERADHLKVLVITGAGEKSFCAGSDVRALADRDALSEVFARGLLYITNKLEQSTKPVIAAINGYAFGGGLELALGCDIRIASENAAFAFPETGLGIIPGAGGTQRLARMVGVGRAKEMILTGRRLSAKEAQEYGLVMKVVPQAQLMEEAEKLAKIMAEKAPLAIALAKRAIRASMDTNLQDGLDMEGLIASVLFSTEDRIEGMTAFKEKRKPEYRRR